MTAMMLNGKPVAEEIKTEVGEDIRKFEELYRSRPGLAVVRIGEDPGSAVYVANKVRTSEELGIRSEHIHLPAETAHDTVIEIVDELNRRDDIDGILVQLPLPAHISDREILERIDPAKDVDGFHPENVGRLSLGQPALVPCTPAGVIRMLKHFGIPIEGRHAVILGRSNIVGKPLAMLLLQHNATVTICHSRTKDLGDVTRQADILVAAIGRPGFVRGAEIKSGATVIDVGINSISDPKMIREFFDGEELEKRLASLEKRGSILVGDVNPKEGLKSAANITPVPGGVGLLTVAMLMRNTVDAAFARRSKTNLIKGKSN